MLTEIGLYRFLFNSRKPIAKPFQKWVSKVIRDIQRNSIYEVEHLKKELKKFKGKEIESIRKANHEALLKAFNKKHIVYFGRIRELHGKILVKIGATKDVKKTFTYRHPKDYGNIMIFHALECKTNKDFEHFLLHHKDIRKYVYTNSVKIGGGKSIEVILVTEDELGKVLRIANRNLRKYPNAAPNIDSEFSNLENKINEIKNLIINSASSSNKDIEEFDSESEEVEVTEAELLAIPAPVKRKRPTRKREKGTGKCSKCNVKISRRAKTCATCVKRKKKFEITKEKLHNLVWVEKLPMTTIGKKYGVSDNAIRKRCKLLGVKLRKRGE